MLSEMARENGFVQNEALSNELAARFYAARNLPTIAACYLRNARDCCLRWGAEGKVRQLEQLHPQLREEPAHLRLATTMEAPLAQFDLAAVVKIYQTVSGEIDLEKLIETLMVMAVEHAGAERGLLVLPQGNKQLIEAEATTGRDTVMVRVLRTPAIPSELPESVLQYVIRTQDSAILDDALTQNPFSADPYIRQKRVRSVLCLPLVKQAKLIGILYLENNLASHVFTPARIAVLKLLASQAAISIENARLYAELISENRDRQRAEDALRVSEERWRSLFENVPIGVGLIDRHGHYVATNQAFQKMLGYSEAELRRRSPIDITHEDDRSVSAAIRAAQISGNTVTWRREKRYRRKDGVSIWADVSSFLLPVARDSPLTAVFAIDITDRKQAEDKLRRSEASLAQAQQISHTGSWRLNLDTGEVGGSTELFRIFGFDQEARLPSYATFMDRIHPEDRSAFEEALEQAARERSRFQYEYRIVLADGSVNYLQSVGQPDNTDVARNEFVGTVIDITERRHAEEALRNAELELIRVARLTTMGQLVASIAHEINQPLAAIVTDGTACLRWLNRDEPNLDEARGSVSRIVREAHRAGDIIHGIRALTRKSAPQKTELTINGAIDEVLSLAHSELQRHGIVLHADLSDEIQPVFGDRVQLQQVLLNLITNAIDAMSTVMDRTRELAVSSVPIEMDGALVAISDTGAGLHPTIAQRIFEPFFTTKSHGLGMGLSICRSIIESHDGRLWVTPNVPYGTVFRFTVPGVPAV